MSGYDQVKPHNIAKEMRTSFIDYAMSVIDVLYQMFVMD